MAGTAIDLSIKVDDAEVLHALRTSTMLAYEHMHDFVDHVARSFRKNFIQDTGINLPANRVAGINAGKNFAFVFEVQPEAKRAPDPATAAAYFSALRFEAYTRVPSMLAHETGATITPQSGNFLAVPIAPGGGKALRVPPRTYRGKRRTGKLLTKRSKGGKLILFERVRRRTGDRVRPEFTRTGRLRKRQRATVQDQLVPRYVLLPQVKLEPRLRFYATWEKLAGDRQDKFRRAADNFLRAVGAGRAPKTFEYQSPYASGFIAAASAN